MRQVAPGKFASDDAKVLAEISVTPGDLTRAFGFIFTTGSDDLDHYHVAAFQDELFGQVLLLSYVNAPSHSTLIIVDSRAPSKDALRRIVTALRLRRTQLEWIREDARPVGLIRHLKGAQGRRRTGRAQKLRTHSPAG